MNAPEISSIVSIKLTNCPLQVKEHQTNSVITQRAARSALLAQPAGKAAGSAHTACSGRECAAAHKQVHTHTAACSLRRSKWENAEEPFLWRTFPFLAANPQALSSRRHHLSFRRLTAYTQNHPVRSRKPTLQGKPAHLPRDTGSAVCSPARC